MDASTKKTAKLRRRWFRFRLRTLLIVVTVLSVSLGWVSWRLQQVGRERATIAWVVEMGGRVVYQSNFNFDKRSWWEKTTYKWFGERVVDVNLHNKQVSDLLPLAELKNLEGLMLGNTQVSDLSPLAELKNLISLTLGNTRVSDLSLLAELKRLTTLSLNSTPVSDLSPLVELKRLRKLHLDNTQVSGEQVQELRQALPHCQISHSIRLEK